MRSDWLGIGFVAVVVAVGMGFGVAVFLEYPALAVVASASFFAGVFFKSRVG